MWERVLSAENFPFWKDAFVWVFFARYSKCYTSWINWEIFYLKNHWDLLGKKMQKYVQEGKFRSHSKILQPWSEKRSCKKNWLLQDVIAELFLHFPEWSEYLIFCKSWGYCCTQPLAVQIQQKIDQKLSSISEPE